MGWRALSTLGVNAAGQFLTGDFAEIIIYNAKLSGGNKTSVKTYISTKYGLTIA